MKQATSFLSALALALASCGSPAAGDSPAQKAQHGEKAFAVTELGRFDEPWALAFLPGDEGTLVTEKRGRLVLLKGDGMRVDVSGVPPVDHGGQGGLGDVVLSPNFKDDRLVYLSWVEPGEGDTRGAVVGRGRLVMAPAPHLEGLEVLWRQAPKVTGRGHYSHRLAFSPDGVDLYIASGERQKMEPAQDRDSDLGKILRLSPGRTRPSMVSMGHRNILGLAFDQQGRLWALEHGPAGGDELNLVKQGANYGWPVVAEGEHYDGRAIPSHSERPEFTPPALSWNPVIAPGGMIFYKGALFPQWRGDAVIAGLKSRALVRVAIDGQTAREVARYPMGARIRAVAEAQDGSLWVLEDGDSGRLLRLAPSPQ